MKPLRKAANHAGGADNVLNLMIKKGNVKVIPGDPAHVREEIWLRATKVGRVLEGILAEPHP